MEELIIILLGFRYLASALPLLSLIGVGIGAGVISSMLLLGLSRNPSVSNYLVR
jgi:F0F1-type ATP synthase membrane subunit c/vacuolar-type H+-ATPase subunit K